MTGTTSLFSVVCRLECDGISRVIPSGPGASLSSDVVSSLVGLTFGVVLGFVFAMILSARDSK